MNGYCTYTVPVREAEPAEPGELAFSSGTRDVPCGKPRVGQVTGPGLRVVLCARHFAKVSRAMLKAPGGLVLEHDQANADPLDVTP